MLSNLPPLIQSFPVGPLGCNCTIIGDLLSKKAIVVDPGGDYQKILQFLNGHSLELSLVIHTHAHFDHFLASGDLQEATGAQLALHPEDRDLWDHLEMQCQLFGVPYRPVPPPDHWLEHQEELPVHSGIALHTPGHTPGSMCFWFESQKLLIAGDTLFKGSVGRTDLWGGNFQKIEQSIRTQLYQLDDDTKVITGHGPSTTIIHEKRFNPIIKG